MNVLLIGRDPTLLDEHAGAGDSRARHLLYARILRAKCGDKSLLRVLTSAKHGQTRDPLHLEDGLSIYPVHHAHRLTYQFNAHRVLKEVLSDWHPDLVSTQTPFQDALVGQRVAKRFGVPLLVQIHFNFMSASWRRESLLARARYPLGRRNLRQADAVRVTSSEVKRGLIETLGIEDHRIHVIPVGVTYQKPTDITPETAKTRLAPQLAGHPVVLFVGRLSPEKNLPLWLDVAKRVLTSQPVTRFLIVGDGPERAAIEQRMRELGLGEQVVMTGNLPYEKLPLAYAASDVFLLTSNHEGYGRVIVEAFLAERPVVATACGGPQDLILDGASGYLLPVGDADGLAQSVTRLLANESLAREMALRGQQEMQRRFALPRLVEHMISAWELTARREQRCVDATRQDQSV